MYLLQEKWPRNFWMPFKATKNGFFKLRIAPAPTVLLAVSTEKMYLLLLLKNYLIYWKIIGILT